MSDTSEVVQDPLRTFGVGHDLLPTLTDLLRGPGVVGAVGSLPPRGQHPEDLVAAVVARRGDPEGRRRWAGASECGTRTQAVFGEHSPVAGLPQAVFRVSGAVGTVVRPHAAVSILLGALQRPRGALEGRSARSVLPGRPAGGHFARKVLREAHGWVVPRRRGRLKGAGQARGRSHGRGADGEASGWTDTAKAWRRGRRRGRGRAPMTGPDRAGWLRADRSQGTLRGRSKWSVA